MLPGAAVAALVINDAAALILTPIVIAMLLALGFSQGTTMAFVMAAGFIVDTANLPLIVSNLVDIVSADFFSLGFTQYASIIIPVDVTAIAATYDVSLLKTPANAIKDPATFMAGWIALLLLLVGFFVLEPLGIPVSAIAAAGAAVLFVVAKIPYHSSIRTLVLSSFQPLSITPSSASHPRQYRHGKYSPPNLPFVMFS